MTVKWVQNLSCLKTISFHQTTVSPLMLYFWIFSKSLITEVWTLFCVLLAYLQPETWEKRWRSEKTTTRLWSAYICKYLSAEIHSELNNIWWCKRRLSRIVIRSICSMDSLFISCILPIVVFYKTKACTNLIYELTMNQKQQKLKLNPSPMALCLNG